MKRVTEHLSKIGANIELKKNLFPPIKIKRNWKCSTINILKYIIPSAQIKSAIMLSALNTNGTSKNKRI